MCGIDRAAVILLLAGACVTPAVDECEPATWATPPAILTGPHLLPEPDSNEASPEEGTFATVALVDGAVLVGNPTHVDDNPDGGSHDGDQALLKPDNHDWFFTTLLPPLAEDKHTFGGSVASVGDVMGDPRLDFAIGYVDTGRLELGSHRGASTGRNEGTYAAWVDVGGGPRAGGDPVWGRGRRRAPRPVHHRRGVVGAGGRGPRAARVVARRRPRRVGRRRRGRRPRPPPRRGSDRVVGAHALRRHRQRGPRRRGRRHRGPSTRSSPPSPSPTSTETAPREVVLGTTTGARVGHLDADGFHERFAVPGAVDAVVTGDFDGDGTTDLVLGGGAEVRWLRGPVSASTEPVTFRTAQWPDDALGDGPGCGGCRRRRRVGPRHRGPEVPAPTTGTLAAQCSGSRG
jgi:hypothetical protein